jgi:hypothetical protein
MFIQCDNAHKYHSMLIRNNTMFASKKYCGKGDGVSWFYKSFEYFIDANIRDYKYTARFFGVWKKKI